MTLLSASQAFAGSIRIADEASVGVLLTGRTYSCPGTACTLSANSLSALLAGGDVVVASSGDAGDISVEAAVSWSGGASGLTLASAQNIVITAPISTVAGGSLTLRADTACAAAGGKITAGVSTVAVDAIAFYHDGFDTTGVAASPATIKTIKLVDSTAEITGLPATGAFALNCDVIDPGGYVPVATFGGSFDGQGHAVIALLVNATASAGLFVTLDAATVSNLVLVRPAVTSTAGAVGALAGTVKDSTITDIAVLDAVVSGANGTGGVAGVVTTSSLNRLYVSGSVTGGNDTGGVVGSIDGAPILGTPATLANAMSKARVIGATNVGGIAGSLGTNALSASTISTSWSAGVVTGTSGVGGAIGARNVLTGVATNVFWDTQASTVATSAGGTGLTTAQTRQQTRFTGFDFANSWAIRESVGRPFLQTLQTLLDVTVTASTVSSPTIITEQATFNATVTPRVSYAPPTGRVRFLDGATAIANGTLTGGVASISTATLGVGIHAIGAIFDGNAYHLENNTSISHTVTAGSTVTTLINVDGPIVATVVSLPPATGVPSGSISFNVDGTNRAPVVTVGGVANLDPSALGAGVHTVIATYTSDDGRFATSTSNAISVTVVGPTTTTLTQNVSSTQLGEAFDLNATVTSGEGMPDGSVRFVADGVDILADVPLTSSAAATSVTTLSAGTHVLIAQFLPSDSNFTASVSVQLSHDITKANATTNLVIADVHEGQVTLNVEVVPGSEGLPAASGEVAIDIDGTAVGNPTLDATGTATFQSTTLTRGSHMVTAHYDGDVNYNASDSAEVEVNVELDGFRLVATPRRSVTFPGGSVPITLTLTPENGVFSQDVSFACSDLPPGALCVFSPASTHVESVGTSVSLLLSTQRAIVAAGTVAPRVPPAMVVVAMLGAAAMVVAMSRMVRRPRLLVAALFCAVFACNSPGGDVVPNEPTPPGTYTVTVTARGESVTRGTTIELEVRE